MLGSGMQQVQTQGTPVKAPQLKHGFSYDVSTQMFILRGLSRVLSTFFDLLLSK